MAERRSGLDRNLSRIVVVKGRKGDRPAPLAHILKALAGDGQVVRGDGTVESKKNN